MNFISMCQRTRELCGISGTGPSSVSSQTGEMGRVVNWVVDSWRDIQLWHEWGFMEGEFTFNTVAGTRDYAYSVASITDFGSWIDDSMRCYLASAGQSGEQFLVPVEYWWFRDVYQFGATNTMQGRPIQFAIRPNDQSLLLGPIPDDVYTIYGRYRKSPQTLSAATDTPTGLQEQYHMMIPYRAAMKYAMYENAPEVLADNRANFSSMLSRLESDWLPDVGVKGTLA